MSGITLRVIDGADRGRLYSDLGTPVTIGREEGNSIQLNDERVSRYHLKIQEDHERLVLTDLESTNGTKVNGEDIQLKILRFGDMITLGRSVLLFGSREEIAHRMSNLRGSDEIARKATVSPASNDKRGSIHGSSFDFELNWAANPEAQHNLLSLDPPEIPDRLTPGQAAQLAELFEYLLIRVRHLLGSVQVENNKAERLSVDFQQWQGLLDLQSRLAEMLSTVTNPDGPNS